MGQSVLYLPELPSIEYFSKASLISNPSTNTIDRCEVAESSDSQVTNDNLINPQNLAARNDIHRPRGKRDTISKVNRGSIFFRKINN